MAKNFTENEPTEKFKQAMVFSEHSPIRTITVDWTWENIPYWVSTEWSRHKFEKFISSQRDDRVDNEIPRGQKPQDTPVNFDGHANLQNLIDAWRKRLCFMATKEARELAEDFKTELNHTNPIEASVLVPNCVYRGCCGEFNPCGFWKAFCERHKDENLLDVETRYRLYNEEFYKL
jgi:thymidylate synthase ThyX